MPFSKPYIVLRLVAPPTTCCIYIDLHVYVITAPPTTCYMIYISSVLIGAYNVLSLETSPEETERESDKVSQPPLDDKQEEETVIVVVKNVYRIEGNWSESTWSPIFYSSFYCTDQTWNGLVVLRESKSCDSHMKSCCMLT